MGKLSEGAKVVISSLAKRYGNVTAVADVSLVIESGFFVTLLGPSGSGKTTVLKLISGFERPTSGEVYINDEPMLRKPPYKRNVGMVFQNYALFPHMTIFQNVAFPLRMRKKGEQEIKKAVMSALDLVKLPGLEDRYPKQLSGGQQQRVALARSIVYGPSVLLMDEPLGALDKKLREHMQLELKRINNELKITIIYVTHDQTEALNMSNLIAVLNGGRLEQVGTPFDLYENPVNYFVADFIGEANFLNGMVTSMEGGTITVTLAFQAGIRAPGNQGISRGNQVYVVIHPEKMQITTSPSQGANSIAGRIKEVLYLGQITKYYVLLEDGTTVHVISHNRSENEMYHSGDAVFIHWAVDDCRVVSA